jgi:hypothetical protein
MLGDNETSKLSPRERSKNGRVYEMVKRLEELCRQGVNHVPSEDRWFKLLPGKAARKEKKDLHPASRLKILDLNQNLIDAFAGNQDLD